MPLYGRLREGSGVVSHETVPAGRHRIQIVATDFHGNQSRLLSDIDIQSPNSARAEIAQRSPATVVPDEFQGSAAGPAQGEPPEQGSASAPEEAVAPHHVVWAPEVERQTGDLTIEKEFHSSYVLITLTSSGAYSSARRSGFGPAAHARFWTSTPSTPAAMSVHSPSTKSDRIASGSRPTLKSTVVRSRR